MADLKQRLRRCEKILLGAAVYDRRPQVPKTRDHFGAHRGPRQSSWPIFSQLLTGCMNAPRYQCENRAGEE